MATLLLAVIVAALLFDFANGMGDSANAIATIVSTRVLSPMSAVIFAGILNFIGSFISIEVAMTIAKKMVDPDRVTLQTLLAAMLGAFAWKIFCTLRGIPVSGSHSLLGGLFGAAVASQGWSVLKWPKIIEALVAMIVSPALGFIIAYILLVIVYWIAYTLSREQVRRTFNLLQMGSSGYVAFTHGTNDAQKVMGVIVLALYVATKNTAVAAGMPEWLRVTDISYIPLWVKFACGIVIGCGTAIGGWKVVKTLGMKLAHIRPIEGFAAETATGLTLTVAAILGIPVSSTHTITGAILGVGAAYRAKSVKWGVGQKIVYAWILTIPGAFIIAAALSLVCNRL
ncbi:MAG TPA: anion permease [Pirellulales bacterium]|jgi:PiT family inorganic phosphate transporter|nr:anion permease [Pirellulales bacterium]